MSGLPTLRAVDLPNRQQTSAARTPSLLPFIPTWLLTFFVGTRLPRAPALWWNACPAPAVAPQSGCCRSEQRAIQRAMLVRVRPLSFQNSSCAERRVNQAAISRMRLMRSVRNAMEQPRSITPCSPRCAWANASKRQCAYFPWWFGSRTWTQMPWNPCVPLRCKP